jgi:hypothetical protein
MIFDIAGIPPEWQRLIYVGQQMDENDEGHTLADYNVTPSSNLWLVLRYLGE